MTKFYSIIIAVALVFNLAITYASLRPVPKDETKVSYLFEVSEAGWPIKHKVSGFLTSKFLDVFFHWQFWVNFIIYLVVIFLLAKLIK